MYRTGVVVAVDEMTVRVRVQLDAEDGLITHWLNVNQAKTHDDKAYWMPDIDEHVNCILDERLEAGTVIGAFYSKEDLPPVQSTEKRHVRFKDGAIVEYDRENSKLTVDTPGEVVVKAGTSITLEAPQLTFRSPSIDWHQS